MKKQQGGARSVLNIKYETKALAMQDYTNFHSVVKVLSGVGYN